MGNLSQPPFATPVTPRVHRNFVPWPAFGNSGATGTVRKMRILHRTLQPPGRPIGCRFGCGHRRQLADPDPPEVDLGAFALQSDPATARATSGDLTNLLSVDV